MEKRQVGTWGRAVTVVGHGRPQAGLSLGHLNWGELSVDLVLSPPKETLLKKTNSQHSCSCARGQVSKERPG